MRKLHVAIVAPSLRSLGGQAVQPDCRLRAWPSELDAHRRAATFRSKHTRAEPRERVTDGAWRPASIK
jgi:hypothetical protein